MSDFAIPPGISTNFTLPTGIFHWSPQQRGVTIFFLEKPILRRFSLEFFSVNFTFLGKRLLLLFAEIIVFNRIYNTTSVFVVVVVVFFFNQAFSTLFLMYHKATACNVIPDIVEVVNLLQTILSCCNTNADGKIFYLLFSFILLCLLTNVQKFSK